MNYLEKIKNKLSFFIGDEVIIPCSLFLICYLVFCLFGKYEYHNNELTNASKFWYSFKSMYEKLFTIYFILYRLKNTKLKIPKIFITSIIIFLILMLLFNILIVFVGEILASKFLNSCVFGSLFIIIVMLYLLKKYLKLKK